MSETQAITFTAADNYFSSFRDTAITDNHCFVFDMLNEELDSFWSSFKDEQQRNNYNSLKETLSAGLTHAFRFYGGGKVYKT